MPTSPRYGYCCRPKLKDYIEQACFDTGQLWFSLEENPSANVDSSNPRRIYDLLRRIVAQGDHGDRYLKDLRRTLIETVQRSWPPSGVRRKLRQQIAEASMDCFQPERLRLDLSWLAKQRGLTVAKLLLDCRRRAKASITLPQLLQPDEYLIDGLPFDELPSWCRFL